MADDRGERAALGAAMALGSLPDEKTSSPSLWEPVEDKAELVSLDSHFNLCLADVGSFGWPEPGRRTFGA